MLGELKIRDRLFLGKEELSRLQEYLVEKTKVILKGGAHGIFSRDDFKVTAASTGSIAVNESLAVDILGNLIYKEKASSIAIPDGTFWLSIMSTDNSVVAGKNFENNLEKGIVNITRSTATVATSAPSTPGTPPTGSVSVNTYSLSGAGTEFTKTLRGTLSSKPVRIAFEADRIYKGLDEALFVLRNNYTGGYLVQDVASDTSATIIDEISAPLEEETNLKYKVIGAFSQNIIPSTSDRYIYNNYGCSLILEPDKGNILPYYADEQKCFLIARVTNNNGTITVEDRRQTFYLTMKEFVRPADWAGTLAPNAGFTYDVSRGDKIQVRFAHFKTHIEIRGQFGATVGTGTICSVPDEYRPQYPVEIRCYHSSGTFVPLLLKEDGAISPISSATNLFGTSGYYRIPAQIAPIK